LAVFGLTVFGTGELYGLPGFGARAGKGFAAETMTAEPLGQAKEGRYGQVRIEWVPPVGDWTRVRLNRRFTGFPVSSPDGTIIHESAKSNNVVVVIDDGLTEGVTAYYTLFVLDESGSSDVWFRAGEAWSIVVEDHDFHWLLMQALPDAAITADYAASDILDEERKYPLTRFLEVIAFELDRFKSLIRPLEALYDPEQTPAAGIPLLVSQFGIVPEPSIGVTRLRSLASNAAYLNSKRGTLPGVEALASVFTGWGATVTEGINLMLREDPDSWSLDGTATFITDLIANPPSDSSAQWGITMGDAAAVRMRTADVAGSEHLYSAPVTASTDYTFSFEVFPETTTEDFTAVLRTYTGDGTFISESAGTPVTAASGGWTTVTHTYNADATALFMEVAIDVTGGTNGDEHFFKNLQLEEAPSATTYEPARQVIFAFESPYTNHITTPSFEDAIAPAFTVTNATPAFDATYARFGADSWQVTPTTPGIDTVVESDDTMPVQAGDPAMVRVSIRPVTTDTDVTVDLVWLDGGASEVSRTSQVFSLTADGWNDMFLAEQAPGTATQVKIEVTWQDTVFNIDAVALVDTYGVQYFDGTTLAGETYWEGGLGNEHNAISYYYPLRQVKTFRLDDVLPNFLPLNRSFALQFDDSP